MKRSLILQVRHKPALFTLIFPYVKNVFLERALLHNTGRVEVEQHQDVQFQFITAGF